MPTVVTSKAEIVVPRSVRRKAGIKAGEPVEFIVSGRVINIIPKLPYADDTFTPEETAQIIRARQEMREGKYVTLAELEHDLARKYPPRRRKPT
ncbi:MAG TPA: AbrB/MazE/SpoVT family DNA-binding domain-containing protein [Bryobacteraceae bacterium]|nr:AbrB/MazE/SpoVT family DNA-binding domain-containing protein [Bryobacteraceae bacterium]